MDPKLVGLYLVGLTQAVVFFRWLFTKAANDKIQSKFVRDVAMNHLPHIYHALQKIASSQGIELGEPPLVQFVELDGKHGA